MIYNDILRDYREKVITQRYRPLDSENAICATLRGHLRNI